VLCKRRARFIMSDNEQDDVASFLVGDAANVVSDGAAGAAVGDGAAGAAVGDGAAGAAVGDGAAGATVGGDGAAGDEEEELSAEEAWAAVEERDKLRLQKIALEEEKARLVKRCDDRDSSIKKLKSENAKLTAEMKETKVSAARICVGALPCECCADLCWCIAM
jgi:hypothetical protein